MHMPVIPDGYGESLWIFDNIGDPDPYLVTHGFAYESPFDPDDWLSAMVTAWLDELRALTSDTVTLRATKLVYNDGGTMIEAEHAAGVAGQNTNNVLPQNCALLVRKRTGLAGRKHKGRMYWPSILSDDLVNPIGQIDTSTITTLQGHFDDVFTALNGVTNAFPALLHTDPLDTPNAVTGYTVDGVIATQRRRLR
jgi:hypothetical protein